MRRFRQEHEIKRDTTGLSAEDIKPLIRTIRGQKVILADDLARLYGVPTKRLNEQVRRNRERFPDDFMFQLILNAIEFRHNASGQTVCLSVQPVA